MSESIQSKIDSLISKSNEDLEFETEENEKLKDFLKIQNELIFNQKMILKLIAEKSKKLLEIENERISNMEEIQKFKNHLKNINKDPQTFDQRIDETITETKVDYDPTSTAEFAEKEILVNKAIETIQDILYSATEKCLKEERSTLSREEIQNIILSTNGIIDMTISAGAATETIEDKIQRQQRVLNSLENKDFD